MYAAHKMTSLTQAWYVDNMRRPALGALKLQCIPRCHNVKLQFRIPYSYFLLSCIAHTNPVSQPPYKYVHVCGDCEHTHLSNVCGPHVLRVRVHWLMWKCSHTQPVQWAHVGDVYSMGVHSVCSSGAPIFIVLGT